MGAASKRKNPCDGVCITFPVFPIFFFFLPDKNSTLRLFCCVVYAFCSFDTFFVLLVLLCWRLDEEAVWKLSIFFFNRHGNEWRLQEEYRTSPCPMSSLLSWFAYALMEIVVLRCWRDVYFGIRAYEAVSWCTSDRRTLRVYKRDFHFKACVYANDLRLLFRIRYIVQRFSVA